MREVRAAHPRVITSTSAPPRQNRQRLQGRLATTIFGFKVGVSPELAAVRDQRVSPLQIDFAQKGTVSNKHYEASHHVSSALPTFFSDVLGLRQASSSPQRCRHRNEP